MSREHAEPVEPDRLGDALAACLEAAEKGETLDRPALLARYPEFALEVERFFAQHAHMNQLTAPLRDVVRAATLDRNGSETAVNARRVPELRDFGDYELLEEVAAGGMGIVYKARQRSLNRIVAVKMILKGTLAREEDVKRFRSEQHARNLADALVGQVAASD